MSQPNDNENLQISLTSSTDGEMEELQDHEPDAPPLDTKILESVRRAPDLKIRPARLASELGISIEDATAELCGLLRAVGSTATFTFEVLETSINTSRTTTTMVFQFPNDFERKAYSSRRKEDVKQVMLNIVYILVKILKVVVAFGLIISLAILLVGGMCAMVAAIIAMSRGGGGGGRHNQRLVNQMRSMFGTFRQLLWCYALFGQGLGGGGQDPFLRDTAHSLVLGMNMLVSSPGSFRFWFNLGRLRDRQRRRGNGSSFGSFMNRGSWRQEQRMQGASTPRTFSSSQDEGQRGILSVAVEFLFGPDPFWPGPSSFDKWKMREHVILSISSNSQGKGVSLAQLLPYTDNPPSTKTSGDCALSADGRAECLNIVSHFNGVPIASNANVESSLARFVFPELVSEAVSGYADSKVGTGIVDTDNSWHSFFYVPENMMGYSTPGQPLSRLASPETDVPTRLVEGHHVLTKLIGKQFGQCCILNALNYIGIIMLWKTIEKGGVLEITNGPTFSFVSGMLSVLQFYAKLFFAIPLFRAAIIAVMNLRINQSNERRRCFAEIVEAKL